MKRLFILAVLFLMMMVPQSWASTPQYPNPYRQTMWNSMTDSMHTLGQNQHQTAASLRRLHQARTNARMRSINESRNQALLRNHGQ